MNKKLNYFCFILLFLTSINIFAKEAKWITASENQSSTNTWLGFRKDFEIEKMPVTLQARIAVDSKYWMWINGKLVIYEGAVKRGPNPNDTYYDSVDIAPHLRPGKNTIAILLWYFGKQGFSYNPSGQAALFFDAKSDSYTLVSDSEWSAFVHPAFYTPVGDKPNFRLSESNIGYDASKEIVDWYKPEYKCNFPAAKVLGSEGDAPWNKLHDRIIPQFRTEGHKNYVSIKRLSGPTLDTLLCRLPYNSHVHPCFSVEAKLGDVIQIFTDHYRGGGPTNVRAEYMAKEGKQNYENLGWMNGHYVYYIFPKELNHIEVYYRESSYDTDLVGTFLCNDNLLNKYWQKAQRTLLVTMRDTYMDCPDRERSQWWGDEVNESGETFYALCPKSHLLTKKGINELIGWQKKNGALYSPVPSSNWNTELPAQMLASIGYYGFWNYYMHTADKQTIKGVYDGAKRYLKVWNHNSDGTVKIRDTEWIWGDWGINIDKEVLMNAWYFIALKGLKNMAHALGYTQDEMSIKSFMEKFKESYNIRFWKEKYYKGIEYQDEIDDRVQALSVLAGLADSEKYEAITDILKTHEYASPYMEKYVTEALFVMGQGEFGLTRMKRRFKSMVENAYYSTLFEGWGIGLDGFGGGSANHAWSGGGLTILSRYVCGIMPIEPGYSTFEIKPIKAGLTFASTSMECIKGTIKVDWKDSQTVFRLKATVPVSTYSLIYIPNENTKKIQCNGHTIWTKEKKNNTYGVEFIGNDNKYITFKVPCGDYSFVALK